MRRKFGPFILLLLVSMKLFADEGVGLVVMNPSTSKPEPYYFGIGWGEKGNLYSQYTGMSNYGDNLGCPSESGFGSCHSKLSWLGATVVDWQPYIFVQDEQGKVWVAQRSGLDSKTWTWKDAGCPFLTPYNCGNIRGLGATSVRDRLNEPQRPYLFVTNDDGKVYNLWRDKNEVWHWSYMKCPGGECGKELKGLGAISVFDASSPSERPYLFAIDDNTSKVWNLWWDTKDATWHWSDMGCPRNNRDKELCGKKYHGLGNMMTSALVRTTLEDGIDIGKTRHPYVFLEEADNPGGVYFLRVLYEKDDKQIGKWWSTTLEGATQVLGVVPALEYDDIIPVIVSLKKDKRLTTTYLSMKSADQFYFRDHDCSSCVLNSLVPISRTHIPNKRTGAIISGVIIYGYFGQKKTEFKTYYFW
ncbi:MAG: hypothetical protein AB2812_13810 [Candidatus Sedimenticola endophacoides]